jgi:beta-glucosidase
MGVCDVSNEVVDDIVRRMTIEEKIAACTGKGLWRTADFPRCGVPSILMCDGTSGVRFQKGSDAPSAPSFAEAMRESFDDDSAVLRTFEATCFPSGSTVANSWDTALLRSIGNAIAAECQSLGINLLLGPGINIRRHPLTARNFEYYSEDPCLAGDLAAGMVQGVQERGVGTSVKHFACHNSDDRRTRVDAVVDERALREIYLAAFERVVRRARPTTVMAAYNKINGVRASESSWLLTKVLRDEWGFEGAVISDWGGVADVVASTRAGLDLQMPRSPSSSARLTEAVARGEVSKQELDARVKNVVRLALRLSSSAGAAPPADFPAHHELARKAAEQSIVLLKNENGLLPIEPGRSKKVVAVIGRLAKEPLYQGTGCAIVHAATVDIPWEQLNALKPEEVELRYAQGYGRGNSVDAALLKEAVAAAQDADCALVFVGSPLPPESDLYNRRSIDLEPGQAQLIDAVSKVNGRTAVIVAAGDCVAMPWADSVSAILWAGFAGEGMGAALADIIYGRKNPSGKLSMTIPVKLSDTPAYLSFTENEFSLRHAEGAYVGYRYYDAREIEPRFCFGFGLSYTRFAYRGLRLSEDSISMPQTLVVGAEIQNTGTRPGSEIVQLYVSQASPRLPRPPRELKGFEKVALQPGERRAVEFRLQERDFAYFDPAVGDWVVDTDRFDICLAASSRDIRLSKTLLVTGRRRPDVPLRVDSGFLELFENEKATAMFFDFIVDAGLLAREQIDPQLKRALAKSFWGLLSYMDMHSSGRVTYGMMREIVDRMDRDAVDRTPSLKPEDG